MAVSNKVYHEVLDVYINKPGVIATGGSSLRQVGRVEEMVASIFAPGAYFYCVFNLARLEVELISESAFAILGMSREDLNARFMLDRYHPDDMDHYIAREKKAMEFLYKYISKEDVVHYKVSQCIRVRTAEGKYRLFLSQSLTIAVDDDYAIGKTFNVFSDVSFLTQVNNQQVSFIGLNGRKSYLNIDPESSFFPTENTYQLSPRELEVVKLIANGHSNKSVAERLKLSPDTVRTHRNNILKKTGLKTTSQLVAVLVREGLV